MIYLLYNETIRERLGMPEIGSLCGTKYDERKFIEKALADFIFTFKDGRTVYMKNRHGAEGQQYTEEEMLLIKLKAVPL